jgi:hypothetical protein
MTFLYIRVSQNFEKYALKRWVHAQIWLLQEKETTLLELCDNWISADDQALHSIAKSIDRPVFALSNLDVDNIVILALLIMQRWRKGDFAALEEVYGEEHLVFTN